MLSERVRSKEAMAVVTRAATRATKEGNAARATKAAAEDNTARLTKAVKAAPASEHERSNSQRDVLA